MGDAGWHVEVCSGWFRKGFIWTIEGSMQRCAPDEFVKIVFGRCEIACGGFAPDDVVNI